MVEDNSIYLGNDPSSNANTAQYNVGVGIDVLNSVTTGRQQYDWFYSLDANTSGEKNTAIGGASLTDNTTGNKNTALGYDHQIFPLENTTLGQNAASTLTTGSYNILLGDDSDVNFPIKCHWPWCNSW